MLGRSIRWDITVELRKLRGRLRQGLSGERVMVISDQTGHELARFTARGPHPSLEEDRWWEAHPELTDKVGVIGGGAHLHARRGRGDDLVTKNTMQGRRPGTPPAAHSPSTRHRR